MEPKLVTARRLLPVLKQLMQREPLFHRPELGTTRADFEKMITSNFWEVGASGRRYSREYVLDVLEKRHTNAFEDRWQTKDFHCAEIAADNFLLTYTLIQGTSDDEKRETRRSTLWRRTSKGWRALYHQGTLILIE